MPLSTRTSLEFVGKIPPIFRIITRNQVFPHANSWIARKRVRFLESFPHQTAYLEAAIQWEV